MPDELKPLLFVAFIPIWLLVFWIIAKVGGWAKLAAHYTREVYGEVDWKRFRSMKLGTAKYKGSIHFGIAREYLYLQPILIFRFAHPTLGIPWRDITIVEERGFFITSYRLTFAKCPDLNMRVYGSFVKAFPNYAKSSVS